ncbi:hypothetical protein FOL46_004460, partial [Perkinsus olseni]
SEASVHLDVCEAILVEAGAGEFVTRGASPDAYFRPAEGLKITVVERLVETLGGSPDTQTLVESARDAVERSCWDWRVIRKHLLNRFARRSTLVARLNQELAALKYSGAKDIDRFLEVGERVFRLAEATSHDKSEHRRVVKRILNTLPERDRVDIIQEVKRLYREVSGSYTASLDKDWAGMFPFTTCIVGNDELGEEITLVDIIRD